MKFNTLLFDVDDTLLDFQLAEKKALRQLFIDEEMELTSEIETTYKKINHQLWSDFEIGKINKDAVLYNRFRLLFEQYNKEVDGKELDDKYRDYLSLGHDLLGNSKKIIEELSPHYDLYIVTNGVAKTQYRRLEASKLIPYFKGIFVSEEVGYQKPMKEYFDYVFDRISNFNKEKTLIIGDSLTSDIQGGNLANIQTAWLNTTKQPLNEQIQPTYVLNQLEDIFPILH